MLTSFERKFVLEFRLLSYYLKSCCNFVVIVFFLEFIMIIVVLLYNANSVYSYRFIDNQNMVFVLVILYIGEFEL